MVSIRIVLYQKNNHERLEMGDLKFRGRISSISFGCQCHHGRQNIFCEQKLADARILLTINRPDRWRWCVSSVAGILEHRLRQKNSEKVRQ